MCVKASKLAQCGWLGEPEAAAGRRPCPRAVPGTLSGASVSLSLLLGEPHPGRLTQSGASGALLPPCVPAVAPEVGSGGNLLHPFPPSGLYLEALGHPGTQKIKILVSDSQTFLLRREKAWGVSLVPDMKVP